MNILSNIICFVLGNLFGVAFMALFISGKLQDEQLKSQIEKRRNEL